MVVMPLLIADKIYARIFNSSGSAVTSAFVVSSTIEVDMGAGRRAGIDGIINRNFWIRHNFFWF